MNNQDQVTGKVKQAVGDLTDNDALHEEGRTDEAAGKLKELADQIEEKVEHAIDAVKEKLHRD